MAHAKGQVVITAAQRAVLERLVRAYTTPTLPGLTERREFEYIRHGTLCLTADFEVATGEVVSYTIGPTRNEQDFVDPITRSIASDPAASWTFVADHLNTHLSATLVEHVARWCGITDDLGRRARAASWRPWTPARPSSPTRATGSGSSTRSWLNQVEIWFSVLARRLLRRSSFRSLEELRERIESFISYFNETLAKPYRWTFTGRALAA